MSEQEKSFLNVFKKQLIIGLTAYFLISIGALTGFYFNTNNSIATQDKEIKEDVKMLIKLQINEK